MSGTLLILSLILAEISVPSWVWDPKDKILGVVIEWIISGIEDAITWIGEGILTVWEEAIFAPLTGAGSAILDAFGAAGDAILDVERMVGNILVDLGASSGVAAPVSIVVMIALLVGLIALVAWITVLIVRVVTPL